MSNHGRYRIDDFTGNIDGEADPYEPCINCGLEPSECICDPVDSLEGLELDDASSDFIEGSVPLDWDW